MSATIEDVINSKKNKVCSKCKETNFHINLVINYKTHSDPHYSFGNKIVAWCGSCEEECDLIERPIIPCNGCGKNNMLDYYKIPSDDDRCDDCDTDVCCVCCNVRVCGFHEEPPHKDERDEAVCNGCYKYL